MLRVLTAFLAVTVLLLSWARTNALQPQREQGVLPIDPPTPYYRFLPDGPARGRVLVVHGLDASKELMQIFCASLADAGFDVIAIDLPGHGDSAVGFTALRARDAVSRALDQLGGVAIVVGHSLGAGLLLDLANDRKLPRMVLISPPPTPLDHVDLSNTLVVTGRLDIPAINAFVPQLEGAEWWQFPWAAHSSTLFNTSQTRAIIQWMGGDDEKIRDSARLGWSLLQLASAILLGICLLPSRPSTRQTVGPAGPGTIQLFAWFGLVSTAGVIILRFVSPMKWLGLFATDYLIGMIFMVGLGLCVVHRFIYSEPWAYKVDWKSIGKAALAACYFIVVVGLLSGSHFMHFALSDGRWWRFAGITFAGFPLFFFDETALRSDRGITTAIRGVITRSLIGAAIVTGALVLNREDAFLVVITHLVVVFWIALWFLTEIFFRHTRNPIATALFASIVQGWFLAAWFVTV